VFWGILGRSVNPVLRCRESLPTPNRRERIDVPPSRVTRRLTQFVKFGEKSFNKLLGS
jgi:hypothetical protein